MTISALFGIIINRYFIIIFSVLLIIDLFMHLVIFYSTPNYLCLYCKFFNDKIILHYDLFLKKSLPLINLNIGFIEYYFVFSGNYEYEFLPPQYKPSIKKFFIIYENENFKDDGVSNYKIENPEDLKDGFCKSVNALKNRNIILFDGTYSNYKFLRHHMPYSQFSDLRNCKINQIEEFEKRYIEELKIKKS